MKAPNEEIYGKSRQEHNVEKLHLAGYCNRFIRFAVVASQICEIPQNSPKNRT